MSNKEKKQQTNAAQAEGVTLDAAQAQAPAEAEVLDAQAGATEQAVSDALALAEDYKRKWYSVTAEYENYRKRTKSDCAKRYAEGRADVVAKLFPIADNLERALAACSDERTGKGIEMVVRAFEKILEEERIEEINPLHAPFDAERMEAVMAVDPAAGEESGTVHEVYRKGYMQDGKVLRFAQVVVVR